jgi:hypothetical protein
MGTHTRGIDRGHLKHLKKIGSLGDFCGTLMAFAKLSNQISGFISRFPAPKLSLRKIYLGASHYTEKV